MTPQLPRHRFVRMGEAFVADDAVIVGRVALGKKSSVWYGAVIRGDIASITIGEETNIQDHCVLHCDPGKDLIVGRRVTLGHSAMVHAREVGDECLIGIGAILLSGSSIGAGCIVGAGTVVREDQQIPPRSIVVGVPGKIIGQTTDEQVQANVDRARRYCEFALAQL